MTFTTIASKPTDRPQDLQPQSIAKFSKISIAASLLTILGAAFIPNLLWMSASHPAEIPCSHSRTVVR